MTLLILGLVAFICVHLLPANRNLRAQLIERLGENTYKGVFSLFSLATLVLLIWGYSRAPFVEVWTPPIWTRHLAMPLMALALIALMAAFFPGKIKQRLKHPMLVSIKIWALAHLLANGDLASMLLFGAFLVYAVIDRILLKRREESIPGQAAAGGRNDVIAIGAGLALYAVIVFGLHEWVIGVPVLAG